MSPDQNPKLKVWDLNAWKLFDQHQGFDSFSNDWSPTSKAIELHALAFRKRWIKCHYIDMTTYRPQLVASTGSKYQCLKENLVEKDVQQSESKTGESGKITYSLGIGTGPNYFKSAQWYVWKSTVSTPADTTGFKVPWRHYYLDFLGGSHAEILYIVFDTADFRFPSRLLTSTPKPDLLIS